MSEISPELKIAYYQTFLAPEHGQMVLADLISCVYNEEYDGGEMAMRVLGRRELVEGILKNCGVSDVDRIAAFAIVAARNQITEPEEDIDLHGD